jgi:lysophospholipase L1-like esterase
VTVNIGDNDVEGCIDARGIDRSCVSAGLAAVRTNLPPIAQALGKSVAAGVPIVGVADYDQFLALWLRGRRGRAIAQESIGVIRELNATIVSAFRGEGLPAADLSRRFATSDLRHSAPLKGHGQVPRGVQRICRWTWACSPPPIGFNDHANATGYSLIAAGVLGQLPRTTARIAAG